MDTADVVSFIISGMGTVLGTLVLLTLLCSGIGALFGRAQAVRDRRDSLEQEGALPPAAMSPELLVVLTAAAEAALDSPVRSIRVRSTGPRHWAQSGRKYHHSSHKVR